MASEIKSARLNRLTSTIESKNKSTISFEQNLSETFKLPTLNAINKSVKYNDLSFTTSRPLNKLRKQPDHLDNIEEAAAHSTLMTIRQKYDHMMKGREQRGHSVQALTTEREKMQIQLQTLRNKKDEGQKKVNALQSQLKDIKCKMQESNIEKKVMVNMIERIRSDKVVYDLRKFNLQKELVYVEKQKHIILKQNAGLREQEDRTKKVYSKLVQHLEEEQQERQIHVNSIEGMINQKTALIENQKIRKSVMQEISQNTLQDKDPQQKNWYKLYLCQKFYDKMLKDKMTREMMKFNTVEMAFKNIKTSTGVSSSDQLVSKFLNKEKVYGELLGKIADDQRQTNELNAEHEELVKQNKRLKQEKAILKANKIEMKDLYKEQKQQQYYSNKATICEMLHQKLKQIILLNLKKINKIQNQHKEITLSHNNADTTHQFKEYLSKINAIIELAQDFDQKQLNLEFAGNQKNLRIKLDQTEETVKKQNKSTHLQAEDDYINNQRNDLIKNNQKFMKELKKKNDEVKKALIDAQPKRKEVLIEKPKVAPTPAV